MSLLQSPLNHSESLELNASQFICTSCQVVFPSSELQRAHHRTDWHKYNLKRKLADLIPVTAQQFNEKVLAQQAKGQEEMERAAMIYHCALCRKTYGTESAYDSHIRSKKHKDNETQQEKPHPHQDIPMNATTDGETTTATGTTHVPGVEDYLTSATISQCLFCNKKHDQFNDNLHHMFKDHGFFLPDVEYLSDARGLVQYLSKKTKSDFSCLYCSKEFQSAQATMTHMVDKGHCKMAYDDSEDVDALLQYYDFGVSALEDDNNDQIPSVERNQHGELVLQNGTRLGNRHFVKHYKQQQQQQQRPSDDDQDNSRSNADDNDDASMTSMTAVMDQQKMQQIQQQPESLLKNRYERRHPHSAITSGQLEEHRLKTDTGILEAAKKNDYQYQIGIKQNVNTTFRLRSQNPII